MIDVSEIVSDPDFAQPFTINRQTGVFVLGGYTTTSTPIPAGGVITVASERDLDQVPEGDRVRGAMLFYSHSQMNVTPESGTSDTITLRGDSYRVVKVWPYADYGFWKALGVRMTGD